MSRKNIINFELKTKFNKKSEPIFKTYNTFYNYLLQRTILQPFFLGNLMQYEESISRFFFTKAKMSKSLKLLISLDY